MSTPKKKEGLGQKVEDEAKALETDVKKNAEKIERKIKGKPAAPAKTPEPTTKPTETKTP